MIAAAIAFTPYVLVSVVNFRPDNFMVAAFFSGLYYYFGYLQEKKLWSLSLSMLLFWASFMFLQKIIFTLVLLAAVTLYLLCRSRILWRDMLYALLLPFGLSLLFAVWLWHHDILSVWYQSNFTFNLHIPELFAGRRVGEFWTELRLLLAGAGLVVLFCWRGANLYFKYWQCCLLRNCVSACSIFRHLRIIFTSCCILPPFCPRFFWKKKFLSAALS